MPQEFSNLFGAENTEGTTLELMLMLELGFGDTFGHELEELMNPLADNLSETFTGAIRSLLEDDETSDAAASLFDSALGGAVDNFGDGLSDLFVHAAKEGVGAFKDLDQVFAGAAGALVQRIGSALPSGLGNTLLGGPQGYQQFGHQLFSDFTSGLGGVQGTGIGFDLANAFSVGNLGSLVGVNEEAAKLGIELAGSDIGKFLGLENSGDFLSDTFGQFNAAGVLGGIAGSALAGVAGFHGSGDPLIDAGFNLAGNVGGAALGTALTPALGAVAGPLGIAVGAFAGQVLASQFADEDFPFAQAHLGIENGQLRVLKSRELDGGPKREIEALAAQVGERFDVLLNQLGGQLEGAEGQIFTTVGFASGRDARLGKGYFAGPNAGFSRGADFTKLAGEDALTAGLVTALQEAIRVGAVSGLSETLLTAIPHIDTADFAQADALLQFANTFDATVRAFSEGVSDPQATASGQVAQQIAGVINQIEEFRKNTQKLGLPLDQATRAMRGFAEFSLGFGDVALEQVSEIELELRRIAELHTLTNAELRILGLSRDDLNAGLVERQRRVTENFLAPFTISAAERANPGSGEKRRIASAYESAIADALLLGVDSFDDIDAHFADAFRALFETLNSTALAEAQRAQQSFTQLGESLREAFEALYFGAGGEGSAEERLGALRGEFDGVATLALGGDETALAALGGTAKELLDATVDVYGDGIEAAALRDFVQDILQQAIGLTQVAAANAAAEIATLSVADISNADALTQGGAVIGVPGEGGPIRVAEAFDVSLPDLSEPIVVDRVQPAESAQNLHEVSGLLGQLLQQSKDVEGRAREQRAETNDYLEEILGRQRQTGALFNA
ncbi:MAG: hypothetical protein ACPG1C_01025 [Alphaproteobacteria bacterium]